MSHCKLPTPSGVCTFVGSGEELRQHVRDVHNTEIYPCYRCYPKMFWSKKELTDHYRNYHSGNTTCLFCPATLKCQKTRTAHILRNHRDLIGFIEQGVPPQNKTTSTETNNLLKAAKDFGLPVESNPKMLINRKEYLNQHDKDKLLWGFQILTRAKVETNVIGIGALKRNYQPDPSLPHLNLTPWGIKRAKFENGHVASVANNRHTTQAFEQCMLMGNIIPQYKQFNTGINQVIDNHLRILTRYWPAVEYCTIPIYGPKHLEKKTINGSTMQVADSFVTIIKLVRQDIKQKLAQAFNIPHNKRMPRDSLFSFRITQGEEVQRLTGYDLLPTNEYELTWNWARETPLFKCPERTCNKTYLQKAIQEQHSKIHENKFRCPVSSCQKLCDTEEQRSNHISSAHTKYECRFCEKIFFDVFKFQSHTRSHTKEPPPQKDKNFKCNYCGKNFQFKVGQDTHVRTHSGETPYPCTICGRTFKTLSHLNYHKKGHDGARPFLCEVCGKAFRDFNTLKVHNRIHTDEKKFSCTICGRQFYTKGNLKTHLREHTNDKSYLCQTCGKSFKRKDGLEVHNRIHTGEKPYTCDTCQKKFRTWDHLNTHKRTHTGERPFPCTICPSRFKKRGNLYEHIRKIHHTEPELKRKRRQSNANPTQTAIQKQKLPNQEFKPPSPRSVQQQGRHLILTTPSPPQKQDSASTLRNNNRAQCPKKNLKSQQQQQQASVTKQIKPSSSSMTRVSRPLTHFEQYFINQVVHAKPCNLFNTKPDSKSKRSTPKKSTNTPPKVPVFDETDDSSQDSDFK